MATLNINLAMEYGPEGGRFHVTGDMSGHGDAADTATLLATAVNKVLTALDLSPEAFLSWMMIVNDFPKEGIELDATEAARQAAQEADP